MNSRQLLILVTLASLWGGSFLFIRLTVPYLGPIPLGAARSLVAALTLLPLLLASGQGKQFLLHWRHLAVLALISTALPITCLSYSTQQTSAGFASIVNAFTPIFSTLIAWLWLKETLTPAAVLGIVLGFAGVMVMVFDRETIATNLVLLPVLVGLTGTLLYGLTGNYSRRYVTGVPALVIATGCQTFSALYLWPVAFLLWPAEPIPLQVWLHVGLLGVFCTGLAFILFFYLLEHVGVARTVIVTYLVPVFAMLWGTLLLDESVTTKMLIGAACILCGIGLTTYRPEHARDR